MQTERNAFIACDCEYSEANTVIFGAPFDSTTSYRPGTRFGSRAIRAESYGIETYSPYQDKDLLDCKIFDAGDPELPMGSSDMALAQIEDAAAEILADGKRPFMLGGEHLVTLGAVRAVYKKYKDLYIIQFDADGQHIAKEAIKLLDTIKKTDSDIVIGSRYLKDMGYPCPFMRRFGTKIFEIIIKLICHQRIADSLSGFQCLNKDVIEYYSKMGNYPEYPDANLVIEMLRAGYKITEVPVKMRLRENGESMHGGIIKPAQYMINMFYTIFFIIIQTPIKKVGSKK